MWLMLRPFFLPASWHQWKQGGTLVTWQETPSWLFWPPPGCFDCSIMQLTSSKEFFLKPWENVARKTSEKLWNILFLFFFKWHLCFKILLLELLFRGRKIHIGVSILPSHFPPQLPKNVAKKNAFFISFLLPLISPVKWISIYLLRSLSG